ncbi:MAG: hypothetical protein ACR2HH_01105 [Chthoniobacterales bacterium]
MISPAEMSFFSESAARYVGREGAVVDLGCWLGATSIALAKGILKHAPDAAMPKERVLGFDTFTWEDWMPAQLTYGLYQPGDSLLPEARRLVRDHGGGAVELIREDLLLFEWKGGAIKILLIDAMKHDSLAGQITRAFYPSLLTGSLLIHQDFKHYYTSWIHVLQYRLREYFEFHRSVPKSGTVAFEVLKPIPREAAHRATDFAGILDEEIDAAFHHSIDLVGPADAANIAASHVMQYVHLGRLDRASELVEIYRPTGMLDKGEFPDLLGRLNIRALASR